MEIEISFIYRDFDTPLYVRFGNYPEIRTGLRAAKKTFNIDAYVEFYEQLLAIGKKIKSFFVL